MPSALTAAMSPTPPPRRAGLELAAAPGRRAQTCSHHIPGAVSHTWGGGKPNTILKKLKTAREQRVALGQFIRMHNNLDFFWSVFDAFCLRIFSDNISRD